MNIKAVELKTSLTKRMIRYYEDRGLINSRRDENNYRNYSENDVNRLILIKSLKEIGFSLDEIVKIFSEEQILNTFHVHLENLLKRKNKNYLAQKENINFIKKVLQSKNTNLISTLQQMTNLNQTDAAENCKYSIHFSHRKNHVVHGHIQALEDFSKEIFFGPSNDYKITDCTYITFKGAFEENIFNRASISMCTQLYSYIAVLTYANEKYEFDFHQKIIQQFNQYWSTTFYHLTAELEALTDDVYDLENIFSLFELAVVLTAENKKDEKIQIIIPGQPLVAYLNQKTGSSLVYSKIFAT